MNVKRILVIILVLGIVFLNGCKDEKEAEVTTTTKKAVTTTAVEKETTTEAETTTEVTTTVAPVTTTVATTVAPTTTTTTAATTSSSTTTEANYLSIEEEMLAQVNAERAKVGKNALTLNGTLCYCAQVRAAEIVESFSHTRPNGTSCFTVLQESNVGYSAAGENIAYGQPTVSAVMNSWMNSDGHRANILSEKYDFNQLGCACFSVNGRCYWVQLFIYA